MSWWYPRLNKRGDIASGNGEIWINGAPISPRTEGHSPQWSGDAEDVMAFIGDEARIIDTRTGAVQGQPGFTFNSRVGNTSGVSTGVGHWCGWNAAQGLIYDGVCVDPGASAGACDQRNGRLYYLTPYQSDYKNIVIDGTTVRAGVVATELVAGEECATWGEYEGARTLYGWCKEAGVRKLSPLAPSELLFVGIPVRTLDGLWLVTQTNLGLIVYPWWGDTHGYILEGEFYYHHAMWIHDRIVIVATDSHGALVRCEVSLASPRVDLSTYRPSSGAVDDVCRIDKPCWMGWFEFTDTLSYLPPSNCNLWIKQGGKITDTAGKQFAFWVQGGSVEDIERQVEACTWPAVAYWDARTWPRFPKLRPQDWLCQQWYCLKDESPDHFEQNMRAVMATVPSSYPQVCGVTQCYDTNLNLTANLSGLVPVFARLARDYPQVTMMLSFTDQGRSDPSTGRGGLEQHPEVKPYWQELYNGITGTPDGGTIPIPPEPIEGVVRVTIHEYDITTARSDPKGCLVRFDAEGPNPIVHVLLDLEGDNEPGIGVSFSTAQAQDGRYCRGLAFKPTVNGVWTLRVTATDSVGNTGQSDGSHRVTVTL